MSKDTTSRRNCLGPDKMTPYDGAAGSDVTSKLYCTPGKWLPLPGILPSGQPITIYLSGPMTGLPEFNAPEFAKYAEKYRRQGFKVLSPPELDAGDVSQPYEYYIRRDVRVLLQDGVDRIYLLKGWQKSKGANLEVHLAKMFKIPLYDAESGELYTENVAEEAIRLVYGDRRETYNNPLSDFGRTAAIVNAVLADKLKEPINAEDVALFMIGVKLSRLSNKRDHRDSLVDIVGYGLCFEWVQDLQRGNNDKV